MAKLTFTAEEVAIFEMARRMYRAGEISEKFVTFIGDSLQPKAA